MKEKSNHDSHRPADGPCIEYLQHEMNRLLMKNETLRFELLALRRKIQCIEATVFGAGSRTLQRQLPPHLLRGLRDLCSNLHGENSPAPRTAPDNILTFRAK